VSRKEVKEKAQEAIMQAVANALISYKENTIQPCEKVESEIISQADRIAKLFGYNKAWHN